MSEKYFNEVSQCGQLGSKNAVVFQSAIQD